MIIGYYIDILKWNTKASNHSQDYKPNANRITTIHRPSLTSAKDKEEEEEEGAGGELNQTGTLSGRRKVGNKTHSTD